MTADEAEEGPVESALDAWQEAFDRGVDLPAAELCRDRPELLPELERRVAVLRRVAALVVPAVEPDTDGPDGDRPDTSEYAVGRVLGGYRLTALLGAGGMGEVYRARDAALGRDVAVKVMPAASAARPESRERFLREARAAAAVRHDHVVPIYHVGDEGGTPFLVMPLLEGEALDARLARVGPLPPGEVARLGREAALGLAAAHAAGLVHRDVKPANLWLEAPQGRVKVLDFGLARSADGSDGLTRAGAILGTAWYMSPEQADGGAVDARSDLFSLGVVLYEAATGVRPFRGTLTAVLRAIAEHAPPPPHELTPALPAALSDLIMRLLAKDPEDRPPSAAAVAEELADMAVGMPAALASKSGARQTRRKRWPVWIAAVVLAAAAGVGIWAATQPPATTADSAQPATSDLTGETQRTVPPTAPVRYRGSVDLYVYRKDNTNSDKLLPLWDPRAMPLKSGDQVQVIAEVDPPAFLYVFWIDDKAEAVPAYPWRFSEWATRPATEVLVSKVDVKWPTGHALKIDGPNKGTETVLMLARPTRLEASDAEVQRWFAGLEPVPFQGDRAKVWFEDYDLLRGDALRAPGKAEDVDGPRGLQAELRRRIGLGTGWSRAVSFSRRGAE